MKKILLLIGLLSYGPRLCAMDGLLSGLKSGLSTVAGVFSPSKAKTGPMDKTEQDHLIGQIQQIIEDEGYPGFVDALSKPANARYFDIPYDAPLNDHHKSIGKLFRNGLSDAHKAYKLMYFARGGKLHLAEELKAHLTGYDLNTIAAAFANEPLYGECINPFIYTYGTQGTFAAKIQTDADAGNADALAIRKAFADDAWKEYHWQFDEAALDKAAKNLKELTDDNVLEILKARKDDKRANPAITEIKKLLLTFVVQQEGVLNTKDASSCEEISAFLTKVKATGIDMLGTKSFDDYITLFSDRATKLKAWAQDKVILEACLASGDLTDAGAAALKGHVTNPDLATFMADIQNNFRTDVIMKELSSTSTLVSIDRLEKWLKAFDDAGIVLVQIDTKNVQSKLTARKDALNKKPDQKPQDNPNDKSKSWFTRRNVAIACGVAALGFGIKYLTKKTESNDKAAATSAKA